MLVIENLNKTYYSRREEFPVLRNVSLTVKKGETFGFLGPNGAGKTTTVKMIVGLATADSGRVSIDKQPAGSLTAQRALGFMSEQPRFYNYLSAREVLQLVAGLFNIAPDKQEKLIDELINKVGLAKAGSRQIGKFSKGMLQRLSLATAIINKPRLLILDEPLDGLDPLGRQDFKQLLIELKKSGTTIFFCSHILADISELCDRIAVIDSGEILFTGTVKELSKGMSLEEAFVKLIKKNRDDND